MTEALLFVALVVLIVTPLWAFPLAHRHAMKGARRSAVDDLITLGVAPDVAREVIVKWDPGFRRVSVEFTPSIEQQIALIFWDGGQR